jgi:formylglycine-generating enzyme required for sulfatase activity
LKHREKVLIPGGRTYTNIHQADVELLTALLGASRANERLVNNEPRVVDVQPFLIDRYPVTKSEFLEFVSTIMSATERFLHDGDRRFWAEYHKRFRYSGDGPIVKVTFEEAMLFAISHGARLPTEEEWERACKGDNVQGFLTGGINERSFASDEYRDDLSDNLLSVDDSNLFRSQFGVASTAGNANEWVDSIPLKPFRGTYADADLALEASRSDIQRQLASSNRIRVVKAISWQEPVLHFGLRYYGNLWERFPGGSIGACRYPLVGFRCAYDIEEWGQ